MRSAQTLRDFGCHYKEHINVGKMEERRETEGEKAKEKKKRKRRKGAKKGEPRVSWD